MRPWEQNIDPLNKEVMRFGQSAAELAREKGFNPAEVNNAAINHSFQKFWERVGQFHYNENSKDVVRLHYFAGFRGGYDNVPGAYQPREGHGYSKE